MKVPLLDLNPQNGLVFKAIKKEFDKLFSTNQYILGPQVKEFEKDICKFLDVKNAIACSSGTDALILALKALDIKQGDEVITTPFTFFATASAIARIGAKPVFTDIKEYTFNIDPSKIENAITDKTKAIIVVHLFGQPAEMDKIMDVAKNHNLKVIEDNAQGIGAKYKGEFAGTIGDIGTLSFFPSKNLGAMGDAGMCITNNEQLAERLYHLRVHGENPKYYHHEIGLNARMDTMQAIVLKEKLPYLKNWSDMRVKNAQFYYDNLSDLKEIALPHIHKNANSIYNQFTIKAQDRNNLMNYLRNNDVGCAIYYPMPLHLQDCFADLSYKKGDFPISEKVAEEVLSIPVYSELNINQKQFVVDKIKEYYKKEEKK